MKLVSVTEMKAIEREADSKGVTYEEMMRRAGLGVADTVEEWFGHLAEKKVVGLVGPGNNGGDTLVALTALIKAGWEATAYLVKERAKKDVHLHAFQTAGGRVLSVSDDPDYVDLDNAVASSTVLMDGLLGTGFRLPLKSDLGQIMKHIREITAKPAVVAVDCPSGVDCDSGEAADEVIPADVTVCMQAIKTGLMRFPAFKFTGEIEVVDLGLPADSQAERQIQREVVTAEQVHALLPERALDSHKGTFGSALIAAGSLNYTGAVLLAAEAAYRVGAGLVRAAVPSVIHSIIAGQIPEATWVLLPNDLGVISEPAAEVLLENLKPSTAVLLGPGWGLEDTTFRFLEAFLRREPMNHARGGIGFLGKEITDSGIDRTLPPLVVDADGLKLLSRIRDWTKVLPADTILTPHPGEMAVMTGLPVDRIQAERLETAESYAREWQQVVVLKGALTIVAAPDGRSTTIPVATPALARAGTGDVLAGLIVGLRAQGLSAYDAAVCGAWIHAQAGLVAACQVGHPAAVLAGDIIRAIADVLQGLG